MTLRITLLVLVTGLFATVWTHDQPAPKTPAPTVAKTMPAGKPAETLATPDFGMWQSAVQPTLNRANQELAGAWNWSYRNLGETSQAWANRQLAGYVRNIQTWLAETPKRPAPPTITIAQVSDANITASEPPLPGDIVPGKYRVVSNTGLVRELTLTWEDLEPHHGEVIEMVRRDIYQEGSAGIRWYFIRLKTGESLKLPILPAVAERSESRRLERQASQLIVNAGQRMASRLVEFLQRPTRMSAQEALKQRL